MTSSQGDPAGDARRWWQAYQLAGNDQAAELGERAAAGDAHARLALAGWLDDRTRTAEAIEVAECDHLGELRQRAARGSYPAVYALAGWLEDHEHLGELRELITSHRQALSAWLVAGHTPAVLRLAAELGDDQARQRLQATLARRRQRAAAADDHPRQHPAGNPG